MRHTKILSGMTLLALASAAGAGAANAQTTTTPPPVAPPTLTTSWSNGSPRVTEEDRQFKVTGRIQYDVYSVEADFPGTTNDLDYTQVDTRRIFLGVQGRYTNNWRYDIKAIITPNGGASNVDDAFIEYVGKNYSIVFGQHNAVAPMERRTSSVNIPFNERSAYINAFGFNKQVGVAFITGGGNWSYGIAVMGDELSAVDAENVDEQIELITRGTYAPYYQNTPDGLRLLHVGATARIRDNGGAGPVGPGANSNPGLQYRARPQVGFNTRFVDTGAIGDSDVFVGVEAAGQWDQFGFNGEYGQISVSPNAGVPAARADRDFSGGYFDLFWSPTGETRNYNAADGTFGKPRIRRTLGSDGGIGHVMLGARYEYLDLTDGPTPAIQTVGGKQQSYVGQITWMPISFVKFQFDYSKHNITRATTAARGDADVITFRSQIDW